MSDMQSLINELNRINAEKMALNQDNETDFSEKGKKLQALVQEEQRIIQEFNAIRQQPPQQQSSNNQMSNPSNIIDKFTGSGGGLASQAGSAGKGGASQLSEVGISGNSGGGLGGLGIGGIVAAAIAAQHIMSNNTDTVFEGQKTNDAFSGNFGTEPWLGYVSDKLGLEPSLGEKFDAAVNNKDWGLAAKRSFATTDQWADPVRALGYGLNEKYLGKTSANLLDPVSWLSRKMEDWL